MLSLCELSRSTFNSWNKSGLDLATEDGTYGLNEIIGVVLLVGARPYLPPKELVGAWRAFTEEERLEALNYARGLTMGQQFDLIVEPQHAALHVARNRDELLEAVRYPGSPRPVVVLDLADRVRKVIDTFNRIKNPTKPRKERSPGRPRSAERGNVHSIRGNGGS